MGAGDCLGAVFPACAGMSPLITQLLKTAPGFPRMRGDEPEAHVVGDPVTVFSPHARG